MDALEVLSPYSSASINTAMHLVIALPWQLGEISGAVPSQDRQARVPRIYVSPLKYMFPDSVA